jgi:hypothetical protein
MPRLPQFDPPAMQNDFPNDPTQYQRLVDLWTKNLNGYTEQSIVGNPWNALHSSNQTFYYNPLTTHIPPGAQPVTHAWFAFPNRIVNYFSSFTQAQQWEFADNGFLADGTPIPEIPTSDAVCAGKSTPTTPYGPFGPRGWQDEYCEWSVTRNAQGKIVRVDFACENPEYWYTLWRIDPDRAAAIYAETLGKPVRKEDLYLTDAHGKPVIDPSTGFPAYNPLNKWNSGTVSTPTSGGAMHLTSTPNTLQTEIGLAGAATVLRQVGNQNAQLLLCCSQYGQPQRNSDPSIGQTVNTVVEGPPANRVSLANPVGLYLQMPNFGGYQLPSNAPSDLSPADFWKIVRGQLTLPGFPAGTNFILHATYEVPAEYGFTVGDITIEGNPIVWASMIAQTFQVALNPLAISASGQQEPLPCIVFLDPTSQPPAKAQPLQIMPLPLWQAYYSTPVQNPRQFPMNLASNTTITPPAVAIGSGMTLALACATVQLGPHGELPVVEFTLPDTKQTDPNIAVSVRSLEDNITYAVPGNTYPSQNQLLTLSIQVAPGAAAGQRGVRITNHGQPASEPAPYFLLVTKEGV